MQAFSIIDLRRQWFRERTGLRIFSALTLTLATGSLATAQQVQPALQIGSPAEGSLVNPGQNVSVTVTSPAGVPFTQVFVVGENPIGFSAIANAVPAQLIVSVPVGLAPRPYLLTAWGVTAQGDLVGSQAVAFDVERPDSPTQITPEPRTIAFESQGEQLPIRIWGTFADGSYLDLTDSSSMAYASSNTGVATVDATGIATAIGAGSASVTATYGQGAQSVHASIAISVPPPTLTLSPTTLTFGNEAVGSVSSSQLLTLTNSSNAALKILSIASTGDFRESDNCIAAGALPSGGTCAANVSFTPTANGARSGTLVITDDFTVVPITVTLTGTSVGDTTPPTTTAAQSPQPNAAGWNNSNVTINLTSVDNPGGSGVAQITYSASGAQTIASTVLSGASSSFIINSEGITTATFFGTDNAGNVEVPRMLIIRLDKTPPFFTTFPSSVTVPPTSVGGAVVTYALPTATDVTSGVSSAGVSCTPSSGSTFPLGTTRVTCTVSDNAGNVTTGNLYVTVHYNFNWTIGKAAPALNSADSGDGYKFAFNLGGNFGLNAVTAISSTPIACGGPRGSGLPEAEGHLGLSYNATSGNYQETFAKAGARAKGTCAQLNLKLNDGTTQAIDIKFGD
jgi:hypothetical protein